MGVAPSGDFGPAVYGSRCCPVVVTIRRLLALWQQGQEMASWLLVETEEALIVLPVL